MVKNKRYLVTDYLKINAPIRGEINEKILGRRFEIREKNNKKKKWRFRCKGSARV
jgi:hypothetical protein